MKTINVLACLLRFSPKYVSSGLVAKTMKIERRDRFYLLNVLCTQARKGMIEKINLVELRGGGKDSKRKVNFADYCDNLKKIGVVFADKAELNSCQSCFRLSERGLGYIKAMQDASDALIM